MSLHRTHRAMRQHAHPAFLRDRPSPLRPCSRDLNIRWVATPHLCVLGRRVEPPHCILTKLVCRLPGRAARRYDAVFAHHQ